LQRESSKDREFKGKARSREADNGIEDRRKFITMIFEQSKVVGAFKISLEPRADERGFFARSWCHNEFEQWGLNPNLVQCNISFNSKKHTMRGMHYQENPYAEAKVVRCTKGAIYDVVLDLRPQSPTFMDWVGVKLTSANRDMLYIPEGCAHGFLTLEEETEVLYQMSEFYKAESARGVRWDDPAFGIQWPATPDLMSERDRTYPDFQCALVY
jgi:dTDP-4-dehydrorhamnose 3,5-epimerase